MQCNFTYPLWNYNVFRRSFRRLRPICVRYTFSVHLLCASRFVCFPVRARSFSCGGRRRWPRRCWLNMFIILFVLWSSLLFNVYNTMNYLWKYYNHLLLALWILFSFPFNGDALRFLFRSTLACFFFFSRARTHTDVDADTYIHF